MTTATTESPARIAGFFVTVRRDSRTGALLGPYDDHDEALANVEAAKAFCIARDPMAHFYEYGTARVTRSIGHPFPRGALNKHIGMYANDDYAAEHHRSRRCQRCGEHRHPIEDCERPA